VGRGAKGGRAAAGEEFEAFEAGAGLTEENGTHHQQRRTMRDDEVDKAIAAQIDEVIATEEKATHHHQGGTMIDAEVVGGQVVVDDERQVDQKKGIVTRHPTLEEIEALMKAEVDRCGHANNLMTMPSWIAEQDGKIIGCLSVRPVFEVLPFPVQSAEGVPVIPSGRAERLLFEACHRWMRSAKNGTGAHYALSVSPDEDTSSQLTRLGWKLVDLAKSSVFWRTF
jgi:hypothetical protein